MAKSTCCSCRGPRFCSKHPQPSVTPGPGDQTFFSGLQAPGMHVVYTYAHMQNIHTYKVKVNKSTKKEGASTESVLLMYCDAYRKTQLDLGLSFPIAFPKVKFGPVQCYLKPLNCMLPSQQSKALLHGWILTRESVSLTVNSDTMLQPRLSIHI